MSFFNILLSHRRELRNVVKPLQLFEVTVRRYNHNWLEVTKVLSTFYQSGNHIISLTTFKVNYLIRKVFTNLVFDFMHDTKRFVPIKSRLVTAFTTIGFVLRKVTTTPVVSTVTGQNHLTIILFEFLVVHTKRVKSHVANHTFVVLPIDKNGSKTYATEVN